MNYEEIIHRYQQRLANAELEAIQAQVAFDGLSAEVNSLRESNSRLESQVRELEEGVSELAPDPMVEGVQDIDS